MPKSKFEEIYKENVSNLYKGADVELKNKIDSVENILKKEESINRVKSALELL